TDTLSFTDSNGAANDLNNVTNIEIITLGAAVTSVTTVDALVAAGQTLTVDGTAATTLTWNGAAETDGAFSITGGAGNDTIIGGAGADTISGGDGNDSITSGAGNDSLAGGGGNDSFVLAVNLTSADTINGGAGTDALSFTDSNGAANDLNNVTNIEIITLGAAVTSVTTVDALVAAGQTLTVDGTAATTLTWNGAAETDGAFSITGGAGNDTITGGSGNDTITSGAGNDSLAGGGGNDSFVLAVNLTSADTINGGAGTDTLSFTDSNGAANDLNNVTNIEIITLGAAVTSVTTVDALVAAGQTLTVDGTALGAGQTLTWNGVAETDGAFSVTGGAGNDTITGGSGNDTIVSGAGNDSLAGGSGNDSFVLAGNLTSADTINGGTGTDTLSFTDSNGASDDLNNVTGIEVITLGAATTNVTTVNALVAAGQTLTVDGTALTSGQTLTWNGIAESNGAFSITGGAGNDTITGGAGNDTIVGAAGNDTINGDSGADSITGGSGSDSLVGGAGADNITGGAGADTMTGGNQQDTFVINSGESSVTVGGVGDSGTIAGYDVITDFLFTTGNADTLDLQGTPAAATGTNVDGANSTLTIAGQTVKSHTISNGIITFDDADAYSAAVSLTSTAHVAAVVQYLQANDIGNAGATVAFTATISGTAHTYVYQQVGATPDSANDILVDLEGVTLADLSTAIGSRVLPAGVAGSPINLALTDPTADANDAITVTLTGVPSGWTLDGGTDLGNGAWTIQTNDPSALTITTPPDFTGAMLLPVTMTWTNADGTTGSMVVLDNVEAYAPGSPIFAVSSDDHLSGSSGADLFVFAQPIARDTIHNFDVAADRIDLIGFTGVSQFGDLAIADDADGNAVITLASGATITVLGVHAADLSAANFLFNFEPTTVNAGTMTISDGAILPLGGLVENSGTIALASTGSETDLQVLVESMTLRGGGQVLLSDNANNVIFGAVSSATLVNEDNLISGAGQIGAGQMTLVNGGTILADGSNALVIDTGSNTVANTGTLAASGAGGLVIESGLWNAGHLWANGGNVDVRGAVSGSGSATISGTATLEFGTASDATIAFADGGSGTLSFDQASGFTGTIAGLAADDSLQFGELVFGSGTQISYTANAANTAGRLTVSDGTHTAELTLVGRYAAADFQGSSAEDGNTVVTNSGSQSNGTVLGGVGADTLVGGDGDDLIIGRTGSDMLTGGAGSDTFMFLRTDADAVDTITDFDTGPGGDTLNVGDLLIRYTAADAAQFFGMREVDGNAIVSIDRDGAGSAYSAQDLLVLQGITGLDNETLMAHIDADPLL
uniref:beta strand repeat-containing protein n=1 Tax=Ramlibacter sp. 2FC TaxID=2502188 RepID=UPI0010F595AF